MEIILLNTSEFYYLDDLHGGELVFVLSFVSSNNTDVETAAQFILLYTRCVCDFASHNSGNSKKTFISYFVFVVLPVFLLLTHDEFLMLSTERSFALRLFAYSEG